VALKKAGLLMMRWQCRLGDGQSYCRCPRWLQLAATAHVGSRALGEVRHRLVNVFLWQLFPDGLQNDFQLISRLRLRLRLFYSSSMALQM